jgi:mono/diheme cytochrome c family protein
LLAAPAYAQNGGALFNTYCAICHEAGGNLQAPNRDVLARMSPEQILMRSNEAR